MASPIDCPDRSRLESLIASGLPEAEVEVLTKHIEHCAHCQQSLESLRVPGASWEELAPGLAQPDTSPEPLQEALERAKVLDSMATVAPTPAGPRAEGLDFLEPSEQAGHLGRLAHYEVLHVVGQGGFGTVLKAFDEKLHRMVAIKVLSPAYAASGAARKRFIREARAAAAVKNEHVVGIYDVKDEAQPPYLVMELIEGISLQDKLDKRGPLGVKEILRIGMQTAEGLAAAHKQGLVHRDIKPANILLENGVERVKITDFGLARAVDDASMTQSGTVAGTPMYMSPEQAAGEMIDHRSDLFSLGTVLYAMCTGHPPFRAIGTHAVLMRVIEDTPRPIRETNVEIPEWLEAIVAKLHGKNRVERFQTAKEVAELLGARLSDLQAGRATEWRAEPRKAPLDARAVEDVLEGHDTNRRLLQHALAASGLVLGLADAYVGIVHGLAAEFYWLFFGWIACFIAAAWVKQRWLAVYRGHRIGFQNSWYTGEALVIDGVLTDCCGVSPCHQLTGVIEAGDGGGDVIVAFPKTRLFSVGCHIVAERQHGPMTTARAAADARRRRALPRPWLRLGLIAGAYALVLVPLLASLTYSDTGLWSTPWIEWIAAPILGLWTLWQMVRQGRPRWLPILPAVVAAFLVVFGFFQWPFATMMHFARLVSEGRFNEANAMLDQHSSAWTLDGGALTVRTLNSRDTVTLDGKFLPVWGWDLSWDHFIYHFRQTRWIGGPMPFTLRSRKTGDKECRFGMVAGWGRVRCETISRFIYTKDNNGWLQERRVSAADWSGKNADVVSKTDQERLQGAWVSVDLQTDGRSRKEGLNIVKWHFTFTGDRCHLKSVTRDGRTSFEQDGLFLMDLGTNPKRFRIVAPAGENQVRQLIGIYEFQGECLRLCYAGHPGVPVNPDYPTAFATKAGSPLQLMTLKRMSTSKNDKDRLQGRWLAESVDNGRQLPADFVSKFSMTIAGNQASWNTPVGPWQAVFHLDEAAKPKKIDMIGADRKAQFGIYRFDGDRLVICAGEDDEKDRPIEFSAKGGKSRLVIVLKRAPAPPDGWVSLFNGKDLKDWKKHPALPGNWRVENDLLVGSGPSHLFSERGDYKDFHLRVEGKINKGGNSGVLFHAKFAYDFQIPNYPPGEMMPSGYELEFASATNSQSFATGSVIRLDPGLPHDKAKTPPIADDTWVTLELIVRGKHIVSKVNGETATDIEEKTLRHPHGHIALQVMPPDTVVKFRKIEIQELPATDKDDKQRLQGAWMAIDIADGFGTTKKGLKRVDWFFTFNGEQAPIKGVSRHTGKEDTFFDQEGVFLPDPSATPKRFRILTPGGDKKVAQLIGIYEFQQDHLRLCFQGHVGAVANPDYPTTFATKPGSDLKVMTFKRLPSPVLPKKAADIPRFVAGTWKVDSEIVEPKLPPDRAKMTGFNVFDPIAGGKFLRGYSNYGDGRFESLMVQRYDTATDSVKGWFFSSRGDNHGPGVGRWNADTRTMLWLETLPGGLRAAYEFRFADVNTIKTRVYYQNDKNEIVFELRGTGTRLPQPVALQPAPVDPQRPIEMQVLDPFVGDWQTVGLSKIKTAKGIEPFKFTTQLKSRPILGGRMIATEETGLPGHEDLYWLMTYDTSLKAYRFWMFNGSGDVTKAGGLWDEKNRTMSWKHTEDDGRSFASTWQQINPDRWQWTTTIRDALGNTLIDVHATKTRRK